MSLIADRTPITTHRVSLLRPWIETREINFTVADMRHLLCRDPCAGKKSSTLLTITISLITPQTPEVTDQVIIHLVRPGRQVLSLLPDPAQIITIEQAIILLQTTEGDAAIPSLK